jgi:hypothetical protein
LQSHPYSTVLIFLYQPNAYRKFFRKYVTYVLLYFIYKPLLDKWFNTCIKFNDEEKVLSYFVHSSSKLFHSTLRKI